MVYRRKQRPSYYSEVRTRAGWQQICWKVDDKRLATKMELMWQELAEKHRAWDILDRVSTGARRSPLAAALDVRTLYDHWVAAAQDVHALRAKLEDMNLAAFVAQYMAIYRSGNRSADTISKVENYLGFLVGPERPLFRSQLGVDMLSGRLAEYEHSTSTRRKVHSAWSGFFDFLVEAKRVLEVNPMSGVDRPAQRRMPIEFYELETVEKIVENQPSTLRQALVALIYGTAMDVSPAVAIVRSDINPATREVRCRGTKSKARDRVVRVADWAWPIFWTHAKLVHPGARVFGERLVKYTASDWHRQVVRALKLKPELPLRCARHHWAVRALRSGMPVRMVQEQMGHASPDMTLEKYGRFLTDPEQRSYWEKRATEYEARRRAGGSEA